MISLTDLHKASGGANRNHPTEWFANDGNRAFIRTLAQKLNLQDSELYETRSGRFGGGTYAHWQIALAYCEWLSPELHMAVNEVYMAFSEAKPALAADIVSHSINAKGVSKMAEIAVSGTNGSRRLRTSPTDFELQDWVVITRLITPSRAALSTGLAM